MLDFRLSEDQIQIVSAVARLLEKQPSASIDRGQVARLGELGWLGIDLPERCGGSGGTLIDGTLVAYEFGRGLASPDLLATQVAGHLAVASGELDLAAAFASGAKSAGFCLAAARSGTEPSKAVGYFLRTDPVAGYVRFLGDECELVEAAGAVRGAGECIDPGMILDIGELSSSKRLMRRADAGELVQRTIILLSAMLAGVAEGSRDLAVAYTKTRKQFGRFIGEFQAIKHHCANMHLRARAAYAQTMHAAMLTTAGLPGAELQAMAALEVSATAAVDNGEMGVHIHGGMGFSEECAAHRFLKRAHLLRIVGSDVVAALGTPFERLAARFAAPAID